jgi:hypothetical protein
MSAIQGSTPYMQRRKFSGSGLTALGQTFSPASGLKWKVLGAYVVLHTSATSGSRFVYMFQDLNKANIGGTEIVNTGSFSTVSSSIIAPLSQTNSSTVSTFVSQGTDMYITEFDQITISGSLISGDTVDYYFVVEETR